MSIRTRWANIVCNEQMQPYLLIVSDGEWSTEVPVKNSRLNTVKLAAKNVYNVPKNHILVTQVFDGQSANDNS